MSDLMYDTRCDMRFDVMCDVLLEATRWLAPVRRTRRLRIAHGERTEVA